MALAFTLQAEISTTNYKTHSIIYDDNNYHF